MADPARVLQQAFEVLRPGGVLIVTEMSGMPKINPGDHGIGQGGLWDLLSVTPTDAPQSDIDWSQVLDQSGFVSLGRHEFRLAASADTVEGSLYLTRHLRWLRERLAGTIPAEAVVDLDAALEELEVGTSGLSFSADRTVWLVARPVSAEARSESGAHLGSSGMEEPDVERRTDRAAPTETADVVVVGGGPAGLAAAVALARSRRSVAVVDAGQPRNAAAEGAHNVLGQEGISPQDLLARGRAEAAGYGVQLISGQATDGFGSIDDFTIEVNQGAGRVRARRVILATGLVDDLPAIPGVQQGWGHTVLHCPFCHGWEVRDQRIAILARDEVAVHHAMMFRQLSDQVTLFLHEAADPTEDQWEQFAALDIPVMRTRVERLIVNGTYVQSVEIEGGQRFAADAVVIAPRFHARTELYEALGGYAESTPFGLQIPTDPRGMTALPGVWAAGNATQPMAMVMASAAAGVTTGSAVHGELGFADLNKAIQLRRQMQ